MAVYKCKMCGGTLEVLDNSGVAVCEYCGTKQTLPRADDEAITNLFNRANRLRLHSEFDKAEEVYEKIINLDDTESEAHWGMVLCKYGIEYVEDPDTFERIPTCHRASYDAVTEDNDYLMAIEHADSIRRELYEEEAKKIEELQRDVLDIVKKEKPFDVFICYKESDENGERTEDSVLAQDIYDSLTDKGYRVFFAKITLENKLGTAYEPYIFAALNSAKVMIVVGTKPEYMDAVWVRNEWSRYLKLMKKDRSKLLIPCYKGMDPYDIPEAFSHLQAQNLAKIGAIQDLVHGVRKIVDNDNAGVPGSVVSASREDAQLDRAFSFLEDGSFALADAACEQAIKTDPENAMAYVGKLMAELHIKQFNAKGFVGKKYKKNENYKKAMELGDEFIKGKFAAIERNNKRLIAMSLVGVLCLLVLIPGIIFTVLQVRYNSAVKNFNTDMSDYSAVYQDFNSLNGYRDSENYVASTLIAMGNVDLAKVENPDRIYLNNKAYLQLDEGGLRIFPNLKEVRFNVSTIDKNVVIGSQTIEKVVCSEGVYAIGDNAFSNCTALKEVVIGGGVKQIGTDAFSNCTALTSIKIPGNVENIAGSFRGCTALKEVVIGDGVKQIGTDAFSNCTALENIELPEGINSIEKGAFDGCTSLESIKIPGSVTKMGVYAFRNCTSLKSVQIAQGVPHIGESSFKDCTALESIEIPDSVTAIYSYAFVGCTGLKRVSIPDSVTYMGDGIFTSYSDLIIDCETPSKPENWSSNWLVNGKATVNWGVKQ